jgi:hypothetical protein
MLCKDCAHFDGEYCSEIVGEEEAPSGDLAKISVWVEDDYGLSAELRVSENFGCVLFKGRSE